MKRYIARGVPLSAEPLLAIESMPAAAQHLPRPEDTATERSVILRLYVCMGCGPTQLDTEPASYYRDVIHSSGYFEAMDKPRRMQYDTWIPAFHLEGEKILEASCGQGELLPILVAYPVKAYGMERSRGPVVKTHEKGLMVVEEYPEREGQILENGPFGTFTLFNLFEHQPDPTAYLRAIADDPAAGGVGLTMVPGFEYILEESSFYELTPDHLSYFTEDSLSSLLNRCGFDALEKERVNRDMISAWIKKKARPDVSRLIEKQKSIARDITGLVNEVATRNKAVIWGTSHQGSSIATSLGLGDKICYIINSTPFKQGHIVPSPRIPIISPDVTAADPTACILIVTPGYTEEIAARIYEKFPAGTGI